jgi:hypothetical protein
MGALHAVRDNLTQTERAATSTTVIAEMADSAGLSSLAQRMSGIPSVGLTAIGFVNER